MGTARRITFFFAFLTLVSGSVHAQDEYTLAQQGFLTKTGGQPVDSMLSMTFKLYKGGVQVWTETHPAVQVAGGNYEVALGSVTPFDTVAFDVPVELGIKIGSDSEMNPRQVLRASPRALSLQNFRVRRVYRDGYGVTVNLIGGHELNDIGSAVISATIGGGGNMHSPNSVTADFGTVSGGTSNQVNGSSGTVGGGFDNESNGSLSVVSGGQSNVASGGGSSVGGGANNAASNSSAVVSGGSTNAASGIASAVSGGLLNQAGGDYSTVGGGWNNAATGEQSAIGGGKDNVASGGQSTIAGGDDNTASSYSASVLGGKSNSATNIYSTVGGGEANQSSGGHTVVGGGYTNVAYGDFATIGGGTNNTTFYRGATVGGGENNTATGSSATVPGGIRNSARGNTSFAAGYRARANHHGSFVWNDRSVVGGADSLLSTAPNQFIVRARGGFGINENNTFAPLHVTNQNIGLSASDAYQEDLIVEAADAVIGLYSSPGDTWGSGINLIEMTSCGVLPCFPLPEFENAWSIVRTTSGGGNDLYFRFGSNTNYATNAAKLVIRDNGNLEVIGALSKGSGSFKIDHPLDPENKYLYHSFVESPDMMNVYNGNVMLDAGGEATVELPSYFEALNRDFRYQLTPIGAPGPNLYIAEEITDGSFRIAGGSPGMKVSWLVTGVRKDPYAELHPIKVEVEKPENEKGTYLHPEAYVNNSKFKMQNAN